MIPATTITATKDMEIAIAVATSPYQSQVNNINKRARINPLSRANNIYFSKRMLMLPH